MAESQFLRMLANQGGTSTISQIECYVDPRLESAFDGCKAGFTSHVVDDGAEVLMFDMAAILPTYIVHYK